MSRSVRYARFARPSSPRQVRAESRADAEPTDPGFNLDLPTSLPVRVHRARSMRGSCSMLHDRAFCAHGASRDDTVCRHGPRASTRTCRPARRRIRRSRFKPGSVDARTRFPCTSRALVGDRHSQRDAPCRTHADASGDPGSNLDPSTCEPGSHALLEHSSATDIRNATREARRLQPLESHSVHPLCTL